MQSVGSAPFLASLAAGNVSLANSTATAEPCPSTVALGMDALTSCVLVQTQVHLCVASHTPA